MVLQCRGTFEPWVNYDSEQGDPYSVTEDELGEDYQSTYVTKYNHLLDRGWTRVNKKWQSPNNSSISYKSIDDAFNSQNLKDVQDGERG